MRHLELPSLPHLHADSPLHLISRELDLLPVQPIDQAPWPMPGEKPQVTFTMAHNRDCLFLKYYVTERTVQARYRKTNDHVYRDSCVEFFISFQGEPSYYNFEFNCLGTCRAGFGPDRHSRELLSVATISRIRHSATLQAAREASPYKTWHLTLVFPVEVFTQHPLLQLEEAAPSANFYKCGDELPEPHYLAWNNILAPEPNFHLPEFFGRMQLQQQPATVKHM
jgi:hypothetical protein